MKKEHINIRVTEEQKNVINQLRKEKTITEFLMKLVEERNDLERNDLGRNDKGGGKSREGRLQTEREN